MEKKNWIILGVAVLIVLVFFSLLVFRDSPEATNNSGGASESGSIFVENNLQTDEDVFLEIDSAVDAIG